jgi:hypothetical protein
VVRQPASVQGSSHVVIKALLIEDPIQLLSRD